MTPPIVSGLPAKQCQVPDCCMCKTTFAEIHSEWICPHCGSHLSTGGVCMNLCGLFYPAALRFNEMLTRAAREAK